MNKNIPDNYRDNPIKYYKEKLSQLDAESVSKRCGLKASESRVFLRLMDSSYSIDVPSFAHRMLSDGTRDYLQDKETQILILHFLTEGGHSDSSGRFISYREYPWGEVYFKAFEGRCLKRLAYSYGSRLDAFSSACEALGAKPISGADRAFELELMDGLYMRLMLWAPDEEFPPSSQILFSDNFPSSFTAEDVAAIGDIVIGALKTAVITAGKA